MPALPFFAVKNDNTIASAAMQVLKKGINPFESLEFKTENK